MRASRLRNMQGCGARTNAVAYVDATRFVAGGAFAQRIDLGKGPMTAAGGSDWFAGSFAR